jgi:C-5 cytosine-specific DNA methylase
MSRPRLLDLFCGGGGAAMGYHRAGFDVVGVDIRPQPRYPFEFVQADALSFPLDGFDAIHASPPCQRYSQATAWRGNRLNHPDLIAPVRGRLEVSGVPYVIENVEAARAVLRDPTMICGDDVGLAIHRRRFFETNWPLNHVGLSLRHEKLAAFEHKHERAYADAMGCYWMSVREAREAIPPAYTELIGRQLIGEIHA